MGICSRVAGMSSICGGGDRALSAYRHSMHRLPYGHGSVRLLVLTSDPSAGILMSDAFPEDGTAARNFGFTDPADAAIGRAARPGDCPVHSTAIRGCFFGGPWVVVSGAAAAGSEGLGEGCLGDLGEQSTGAFLHPDGQRPESTDTKDRPLAPRGECHRPDFGARRGGISDVLA